jgi:NADPH:quinone reductase-like Zn-dependent oxidoreductase
MLVRRAKVKAGETVFIWGAGSGVGSIAIQIAKEKGCLVIAAGGTEEKLNLAQELGADKVLNYKIVDVIEEVNRFTDGGGVDVIFEHVGAKTWNTSLKILGKGGRLVTCGATTGAHVEIDIRYLFYKQQSIMGSTMGDVAAFDEVIQLLEEKKIRPVIDKVFPMKNIRDAHVYLEESHQAGKVILVP